MARLKRSFTILETARQRLAGLKSITPRPNFGPALDLDQYEQDINAYAANLDQYNNTLSLLDRLQNDLDTGEAQLRDKNKRMLAATGAHYGDDSNEYETVGGTAPATTNAPPKRSSPPPNHPNPTTPDGRRHTLHGSDAAHHPSPPTQDAP